MEDALRLLCGICWTSAYVLIILRAFKDRTYGMPLPALCANLSWEFIFSFIYPNPGIQRSVNVIWLLFDLVIFYQFFAYGRAHFPRLSKAHFAIGTAVGLICGFCLVLFISMEARDFRGGYVAYGQNLLMSILFVHFIYMRHSVAGQSLYIALLKMIGTALAGCVYLGFRNFGHSPLMPFLMGAIFFFDLVYVCMVYQRCKAEGLNPWRRF